MLLETSCRLATAAHRLMPALVEQARQGGVLRTYSDLNAEHIRMDSVNDVHMGKVLDIVHHTCMQNGLPDLAALAVNKARGEPGQRYCLRDSWQNELAKIRAYDWSRVGRLNVTVTIRMH